MQQPVMEESISREESTPVKSYDDLFPALPESNNSNHYVSVDNSNMRVGSSKITHVFRVPFDERKLDGSQKFGEGESIQTCSMIMQETGAQIEIISHAKDQSLTFLVFGKYNEVAEARRKILIHFQAQVCRQMQIPKEYHRWILGKKGGHLRDIEKETDTKISVPPMNDPSEIITITGSKEGIEKAEHVIRVNVEKQSKKAHESLNIPKIYHPFIIGPYSEHLNKLMEETGTRITVPSHLVLKDEIFIAGEKDGVLAAKTRIETIYNEMKKKCTTVSVEVPKSQHKYVIGPKGATIAEILQKTGISVEVPPSDAASDTITLRGPHDKLGDALTRVCEKANSVQRVDLNVQAWLHKHIMGPKRQNINEITAQAPETRVEFNERDGRIRIEGPPEEVEKVKTDIEKHVYYLSQKLDVAELHVDPKLFKHIIGKSGANVNRLKDEFNVLIGIEESGVVRIEGSQDCVATAKNQLEDTIKRLENIAEVELVVEQRYHRQIIGAKGDKIREIRDRFKIQISLPGSENRTNVVRLRGPTEDVERCKRYLENIVQQAKANYHVDVPIHKPFHKFVIGKGGVNIRRIREETSTQIDVPEENDASNAITISGNKANVEQAVEKILKIQGELETVVEEVITIPPQFYNSLIGTKGKLIHTIMQDCGDVAIKFPTADSNSDEVVIRGRKDGVEKAKKQLIKLTKERQLASFTAEIRAKPEHHKFLIGKNGVNVKKIRDETGTRIIFPSNGDEDRELITITGTQESVLKAKAALQQTIDEIHNIVEDEIMVEQRHHRHFVQKRGELLHRLALENGGVLISFPRPGEISERVVLKGSEESIESTKQAIRDIIIDLEARITIECIIPQKHHRSVMGSRGSNVQNITSTYDVQIKFPERNKYDDTQMVNGEIKDNYLSSDTIYIVGKEENCISAKEALINLIPVTISIEVPYDLHRSIIGQKGRDVKELMDHFDVHIVLSPPDQKDDFIKITGSADNVEEAKVALLKRVDQVKTERELRAFTVQLEVKPEYHPKIIGRQGGVISKIRADHDVQIVFPRKHDTNDNLITISGYEQNVLMARDDIMKIVMELDDLVKESVEIDSKVHSRLIGTRGRTIRKIMSNFHVEITFPRASDENCNTIVISGSKDNVLDAKDHLLNLADDYLQDIEDQESRNKLYNSMHIMSNSRQNHIDDATTNGFIVHGAPWEQKAPNTSSVTEFPTFGQNTEEPSISLASGAWGNRR